MKLISLLIIYYTVCLNSNVSEHSRSTITTRTNWHKNDTMTQIIYEIFYLKRKESTITRKYDLDLWRVKHLLALFKRNLNSIKADNRRLLNKRK